MDYKGHLNKLVKTDTDKQLKDRLYEITLTTESYLDDPDQFVMSRFIFLDTQDTRKRLLDYINKYDITDTQDVHEIESCIIDGVEPEFTVEPKDSQNG